MIRVVTVLPSGSVPLRVGTVTWVVLPGLALDDDAATAVGRRSMPKFALLTSLPATATARLPLTEPSLPAPLPRNSPVLTQPVGRAAAGALAPALPCVVLSTTV